MKLFVVTAKVDYFLEDNWQSFCKQINMWGWETREAAQESIERNKRIWGKTGHQRIVELNVSIVEEETK